MALEDLTGSKTIESLNRNNPVGIDAKQFGDDHIRGFKNVLLNTFKNITGVVNATHTELSHSAGVTSLIQDQIDAINAAIDGKRYVEAGTIAAYPAGVPSGWLECDGSSQLRTGANADLFAYLGVTYGNVDGMHFNLPDYRGYALRHADGGTGVDPGAGSRTDRGDGAVGDVVGTKQSDQMIEHEHDYYGYTSGNVGAGGGTTALRNSILFTTTKTGAGTETRMKNINVIWCIKT